MPSYRRAPVRVLLALLMTCGSVGLATPALAAAHPVTSHLKVAATPTTARIGSLVTVHGTMTPRTAGVLLSVQTQVKHRWVTITHVKTTKGGVYAVSPRAPRSTASWTLRVIRPAARTAKLAVSSTLHIRVVKAFYTVFASAPTQASVTGPIVVTGSISPRATGSVTLQLFRAKTWHAVGSAVLTPASTFTVSTTQALGTYQLRVAKAFSSKVAAGTGQAFTVVVVPVAAPTITTFTLPGATTGHPYTATLTASGGTAPYTWTATGLPAGLTVSAGGVISGTPAAYGVSAVSVTVTDALGKATKASIALTVTSGAIGNTVRAWGDGSFGALGNGTTSDSHTPVTVTGLTGVTQVVAGNDTGYALRYDGTVWAWGYNIVGEIGDGTTVSRSVPVQVNGLTGVTAIAAGNSTGYALRSDGTVWAWGEGLDGALGNGGVANALTPVQVSSLTGVTAIAGGAFDGYAVTGDGSEWSWGDNGTGQLGTGVAGGHSLVPVQVHTLIGVTAIAAFEGSAYAVLAGGAVWVWGDNTAGRLGDGTTTERDSPVELPGITTAKSVAAGGSAGYALLADGTVRAWGNGIEGELGDGLGTNSLTPVAVIGLTDVTSIAGGNSDGYAVLPDGTARVWGFNSSGEIGNGSTTNALAPTKPTALPAVLQLAGENQTSYAVVGPS
jgi:alpha-tubulin suppressor-like RCC1 family protein